MRGEHGGGIPESTAFAKRLRALKREGSNILLVGRASNHAHGAACHRLLGADDDGDRRRLFVFTEGVDPCARLPGESATPETVRVITQRSAVPTDPNGQSVPTTVVTSELLSALGTHLMGAIDDFEDESGGLAPAELRLCFDSLGSLLEHHTPENVFRLLHMVTARVRHVDGMGHYHLRVDRESDAAVLLEPLFDAVVEVDADGETVEHRWHLRDEDVSSGWLPL